MYRCDKCKRAVGPNIPESRFPKGRRPNGQITGELTVCPFCAVVLSNADTETTIATRKAYMHDKKRVMLRLGEESA